MEHYWYLVMFKHNEEISAHPVGLTEPVKPGDLENAFMDVLVSVLGISPEKTTILAISPLGTA